MTSNYQPMEKFMEFATPLEKVLYEALKDALPALWLTATSGHPDAVRIHDNARGAISRAENQPQAA